MRQFLQKKRIMERNETSFKWERDIADGWSKPAMDMAMFGTKKKTIIFQLVNNINVISENTCVIVRFIHC